MIHPSDSPATEALIRRFEQVQRDTIAARPRDPNITVTGDVQQALAPLVWAELVPHVLPSIERQDGAILRWLCGWEPETIARVVRLIQRAGKEARRG